MNKNIWSTFSNLTLTNKPVSCELLVYKLSWTIWLSSLSDPLFLWLFEINSKKYFVIPQIALVIIFSFIWLMKYPFLQSEDSVMMTEGLLIWTEMIWEHKG